MMVLGVDMSGPPGCWRPCEGEAWEGEVLGDDAGGYGVVTLGVAEGQGACYAVPELGGGADAVGNRAIFVVNCGYVRTAHFERNVGNVYGDGPGRVGF